MEFTLIRHPLSPASAIDTISVEISRSTDARLALCYRMTGDITSLAMPFIMAKERADDLWRTTCFEAFLKRPGSTRYVEFNFSPSTRWAGYIFDGYREGRRDFSCAGLPRLDIRAGTNSLELGAILSLPGAESSDWQSVDLALGLSAVIETRGGEKSYWALAHPPGEPDFHAGDCFAGLLRAPGGS
jgi:hypothetical protein